MMVIFTSGLITTNMSKIGNIADDLDDSLDTSTESYQIWIDAAYNAWKQLEKKGFLSVEDYGNWVQVGINNEFLMETNNIEENENGKQ